MAKWLNYWWNGQKFCWIHANLIWELALDFEYPGGLGSQICVLHPQVSKQSSVVDFCYLLENVIEVFTLLTYVWLDPMS